jgi:2-keto-4-pentenoate hydratase
VAGLAPALELVDLDIDFGDLAAVLAGNICHRRVIFGAEVSGVDYADVAVAVRRAGEVMAEGGAEQDPADTAAFVARFLAAHGSALVPGERIICGSMVAPVSVAPGDELTVTFGPLGELRVAFA